MSQYQAYLDYKPSSQVLAVLDNPMHAVMTERKFLRKFSDVVSNRWHGRSSLRPNEEDVVNATQATRMVADRTIQDVSKLLKISPRTIPQIFHKNDALPVLIGERCEKLYPGGSRFNVQQIVTALLIGIPEVRVQIGGYIGEYTVGLAALIHSAIETAPEDILAVTLSLDL